CGFAAAGEIENKVRDREGAITNTRGACAPRNSRSEFLFDQPMQMCRDRRVIEALDDFVQEAGDEKALRHFCGNAAATQVKQLVFFNLARRRTVGATNIIGKNFETWH